MVKALLQALPSARFLFLFRERRAGVGSQSRAFGFDAEALALLLRQSIVAYHEVASCGRKASIVWYEEMIRSAEAPVSLGP